MCHILIYGNNGDPAGGLMFKTMLRPVHLLRVFLLRVLESNFPGDSL